MDRAYGFVRMQAKAARRVARSEPLITVSESSRRDIWRDFKIPPSQVHVIPLGVDTRVFRPRETARVPGRIIAVASADSAIKGVATLLRAVGKLATERDVHLVVTRPSDSTERLIAQLSLPTGSRSPTG
jgi:glycosyltransferase involved in cell wall biosynthesis